MATFIGKDVKKLKAKGGGKWKYLSVCTTLGESFCITP